MDRSGLREDGVHRAGKSVGDGPTKPYRSRHASNAPAWKPSCSFKAPLGLFAVMPTVVSSVS